MLYDDVYFLRSLLRASAQRAQLMAGGGCGGGGEPSWLLSRRLVGLLLLLVVVNWRQVLGFTTYMNMARIINTMAMVKLPPLSPPAVCPGICETLPLTAKMYGTLRYVCYSYLADTHHRCTQCPCKHSDSGESVWELQRGWCKWYLCGCMWQLTKLINRCMAISCDQMHSQPSNSSPMVIYQFIYVCLTWYTHC